MVNLLESVDCCGKESQDVVHICKDYSWKKNLMLSAWNGRWITWVFRILKSAVTADDFSSSLILSSSTEAKGHAINTIQQSINQWVNQSINGSVNQSINQWVSQSINQSMGQSMNQWVSQSINGSINQSVGQKQGLSAWFQILFWTHFHQNFDKRKKSLKAYLK